MKVDNLIERMYHLDTCAVSDAMEQMGLKGAAIGIRPMWPSSRIAGRAVTVKIKPVGLERPEEHLGTAAIDAAKAGDILVFDNAGRTDVACWGGILSLASTIKQLTGVVIDGVCRNLDETEEMGFPVFARGAVPVTCRGRLMEESFNQEIQFGDISVRPNDLVMADKNGVVIVPSAIAEEVIERAEDITNQEKLMAFAVRAGQSVLEVTRNMKYESMLLRDK